MVMKTKTDYLPEWNQMPINGQYAAIYRFFARSSWSYLRDPQTKQKLLFSTAGQAIAAAREFVRKTLNPELRSMTADEPESDPSKELAEKLGVNSWRQSKQEERAENQIIRNRKSKRRVIVERKGEGKGRGRKAK